MRYLLRTAPRHAFRRHPLSTEAIPSPTSDQLRNHFIKSALPMVGFGFMDQTVMLQAGNAIDCTIGVTFGLSTLTAAAIGQICSDTAGVLFGSTVETFFRAMGLPPTGFTSAQRGLAAVKRVGLAGNLIGVITGCLLGLTNLLFIDTSRSTALKLQAKNQEQEFAFSVEASNTVRDDATVLTVSGPDIDGLLASMTAALTAEGCSLKELHASERDGHMIEDTFVITQGGEPVADEDLKKVAGALLEATYAPVNVRSFQIHVKELEDENNALSERIKMLEHVIQDRQIKLSPAKEMPKQKQ